MLQKRYASILSVYPTSAIIKTYFELDPEIRKAAISFFKSKLVSAVAADPGLLIPDTPEEIEKLYPPVDIAAKKKSS